METFFGLFMIFNCHFLKIAFKESPLFGAALVTALSKYSVFFVLFFLVFLSALMLRT